MKSDTLRLSNPFAGHEGCRVCLPRLLTEVETVSGVRFVRLTEGADGDSIEVEYDSSLLTSQKLQVQFIQISKPYFDMPLLI